MDVKEEDSPTTDLALRLDLTTPFEVEHPDFSVDLKKDELTGSYIVSLYREETEAIELEIEGLPKANGIIYKWNPVATYCVPYPYMAMVMVSDRLNLLFTELFSEYIEKS